MFARAMSRNLTALGGAILLMIPQIEMESPVVITFIKSRIKSIVFLLEKVGKNGRNLLISRLHIYLKLVK